jgi:hypothetical protein
VEDKPPNLTVQRGPSPGYEARLQGILAISSNCLVVVKAGRHIDVAWPKNWITAVRGGAIVLLDATGKTVAAIGDEISLSGGYIPPTQANVTPCTNAPKVFATNGLT